MANLALFKQYLQKIGLNSLNLFFELNRANSYTKQKMKWQ